MTLNEVEQSPATNRDEVVKLPQPFAPIANYVAAVRVGELVFVSGQGPIDTESGQKIVGKVGDTVSVEDARFAARLAGLIVEPSLGWPFLSAHG